MLTHLMDTGDVGTIDSLWEANMELLDEKSSD